MNEILPLKSKAQSWRDIIEAQLQSGKSIRAFCEAHQIKRATFCYWKQKLQNLKLRSLQSEHPSSRFLTIANKRYSASRTPRILLPNGVQIELGEGLGSGAVNQLIRNLCGVGHAKP